MRTHETTVGEGGAPVTCQYHFDSDGDLDSLAVMLDGDDIKDNLSESEIERIESECRAAAKADYEEHRDDARIDAYIEEMAA